MTGSYTLKLEKQVICSNIYVLIICLTKDYNAYLYACLCVCLCLTEYGESSESMKKWWKILRGRRCLVLLQFNYAMLCSYSWETCPLLSRNGGEMGWRMGTQRRVGDSEEVGGTAVRI